ncbi:unnamed protein product [Moneuplotes crassus]|uniref:Uncharacterized protein n=1 Tax=Euplotes crassus TaxID=5936 RepID=A0AAD1Y8W3_EUPCR|nr:unnamed protein product [Moneuplotes crassus]
MEFIKQRNKLLVLDFEDVHVQGLFLKKPLGREVKECIDREFCERFVDVVVSNGIVLYIYVNTTSYQRDMIRELLDYIFKDEKSSYKLISSKPLFFLSLGLLLDRKFSVIIYSGEKHFIPREIYQELEITRDSLPCISVKNAALLKNFNIDTYQDNFHASDLTLCKVCLPNFDKFEAASTLSPEINMTNSFASTSASSISTKCSTVGLSLSGKGHNMEEETKTSTFISESSSSTLKNFDKKYKEIFNDLLLKLVNKKQEKSKEFAKLMADLDNTVKQHLQKYKKMDTQEKEDFFVYTFFTLCQKEWLRGELPTLLIDIFNNSPISYMELIHINEVDLVIDASKIVSISKRSKLKKLGNFEKKNAESLSKIMTSVLKTMLKEQEVNKTTSLSMTKLKEKVTNWLQTYSKMNKADKSARIIFYYKPMPNTIIQALKSKEIIIEVEGSVQINSINLEYIYSQASKVPENAYFVPYFAI